MCPEEAPESGPPRQIDIIAKASFVLAPLSGRILE
jgi:hypothetical protein